MRLIIVKSFLAKYKIFFFFSLIPFLIIAFQNCSKNNFDLADSKANFLASLSEASNVRVKSANLVSPKIGIFYSLWHCPISSSANYNVGQTVFDISRILQLNGSWGPINTFHWWGMPDDGYYCLAENTEILSKHAQLLADAGIDFVYVDSTNWSNTATSGQMVIDPFNKLMQTWSQIPNAPKVVPWVPMVSGGDMANYFDSMLSQYPQMAFQYEGKPLMLAVGHNAEDAVIQGFQSRYTIRKMWGFLTPDQMSQGEWSFMQDCKEGFTTSQGDTLCSQSVSSNSGSVEQIPVVSAYQYYYMSNAGSTPKFNGKTLLRQLETAYLNPGAPIVTITGWNEWIAQRFCPDGTTTCDSSNDSLPNGNKLFVDQYNYEYNRDLEPGGGLGPYYYNLLKAAISLLRSGQNPMGASSSVPFSATVTGIVDGVTNNSDGSSSINGWACSTGSPQSIYVDLYLSGGVGVGTGIGRFLANVASESAVAAACQSTGSAYRFQIPLSADFINQHSGAAIYIHGISPVGLSNLLLGNSGTYAVPQPLAPSCTSGQHASGGACVSNSQACSITNGAGAQNWNGSDWGACQLINCNPGTFANGNSCLAPGAITGMIDGIYGSPGQYTVNGWACAMYDPISIQVHLYLGGAAGSGTFIGAYAASNSSESAVAAACQSTGSAYRFSIPLPTAVLNLYSGQPIYVHGISPNGGGNSLLSASGSYTAPSGDYNNIYRFYAPWSGEHFFSTSYAEGTSAGYLVEGVGFKVVARQDAFAIRALYRCYWSAASRHFISTDYACEGLSLEGLYGYIYDSQFAGTVPLYRFYSPLNQDHLTTTNYVEGINAGYTLEGVLGYVPRLFP